MPTTFRNKGGDYRRPNGQIIPAGTPFTTTAKEDMLHWPKKHQIGTMFERIDEAPAAPSTVVVAVKVESVDAAGVAAALTAGSEEIKEAVKAAVTEKTDEKTETPPDEKTDEKTETPPVPAAWTAKISPEQYLARFGEEAPQSALARQLVDAAAKA